MRKTIFGLVLLTLMTPAAASEPLTLEGVPEIEDGDSLRLGTQRIRLFGIDAPEWDQTCQRAGISWRCGDEATNALAGKLLNGRRWVRCEERDRDNYGRIRAVCHMAGEDINGWMVRHGHAVKYTEHSEDRYAVEEAEARRNRRGLWAGTFTMPWEWRRRMRPLRAHVHRGAAPSPDDKVVFGLNADGPDAATLIIGIPEGAWAQMRAGKTHTVDLRSVGAPVRIVLFGAEDHEEAKAVVIRHSSAQGLATLDARRDFGTSARHDAR